MSKGVQRQSLTVHYRRLQDATGAFGKNSLEGAVRNAMQIQIHGKPISANWKARAFADPPNIETLLMNQHYDAGTHFFGDLTQYTTGYLQALLGDQPDAAMLPIEQQPPPKGKEYVHSMMYWLVVGNHLLMIPSRSLSGKHLEDYLTWLLKDRAAVIGPTGHVILKAKFDVGKKGGTLSDIREIVVGGRGASLTRLEAAELERVDEVNVHRDVATKRPIKDRMLDVLRVVTNNEADLKSLLENIPDEASLEVEVHIGYRTKKRRLSRAPMQAALRNLPEGEVTAIGRDGKLTGSDLRLSHPVNVKKIGSLLDPADAKRALVEAYEYFHNNGKLALD